MLSVIRKFWIPAPGAISRAVSAVQGMEDKDLCAEFGVCKSTMSKVFDKLSFYGLIRTSPHGTFVCQREENTEKRRKFAAIISRKLGRDEDFFTSELKKQLENRNISSILIQVGADDLRNPDFFRRLNFDGYIFIYSIFYHITGGYGESCASPRVVANWLPEGTGEYFVDFDLAAGLENIAAQFAQMNFRRIALAIESMRPDCTEIYHGIWKKLVRRYKLINYNSSLNDFCYSEALIRRWTAKRNPPEIVLCVNVPLGQAAGDLLRSGLQAKLCTIGDDTRDYLRLAEMLAKTFAAVLDGEAQPARRTLIGRYVDVEQWKLYDKEDLLQLVNENIINNK